MNDIFEVLKTVFGKHKRLALKSDTPKDYTLTGKKPSPFPQHKGDAMWFGSVRLGKAYVSFHLMPLYMNPTLIAQIPPDLKKRMQGKTCFNFKKLPEPQQIANLKILTAAAVADWAERGWL